MRQRAGGVGGGKWEIRASKPNSEAKVDEGQRREIYWLLSSPGPGQFSLYHPTLE